MDLCGVFVPAETLSAVFETLVVEDVKRARHVCKIWNDLSTPFLLPIIYLSTQLKDRENLTQISHHPTLRKSVREIIYDSTVYVDSLQRSGDLWRKYLCSSLPSCRADQTYSEEAVSRGFSVYAEAYSVQEGLFDYCGRYLTRPADDASRPKHFNEMLFEPRFLDHIAEFLPDDLVRLVRALPKMPNVTRMILSDRRWTSRKGQYRCLPRMSPYRRQGFIFGVQNQGVPGLEQVVHHPQEWPDDHHAYYDPNQWRGFRVIIQAIAMAETHNVKHFSVQSGDEGSGLAWGALADTLQEHGLLDRAFHNLKSLELKIDRTQPESNEWCSALGHGRLARTLASIQGLERLSIGLNKTFMSLEIDSPGFEHMSLTGLVGQHQWQHLRYVYFADMMVSQQELLDFLARHRKTLCHLVLSCVQFPGAEVLPDFNEDDDMGPYINNPFIAGHRTNQGRLEGWYNYLRALAEHDLNLQTFSLILEQSLTRKERLWFHACNENDILQLLRSGGKDRHSSICSHDQDFEENKPLTRPQSALWMNTSTRILGCNGYDEYE
ncbi:MAG: hypothetical protein LQ346_007571 [Caloplaca aetnensis]|nr:MAG: hypothetical protein LQ346_007571 [Caloplaca aetnensis]